MGLFDWLKPKKKQETSVIPETEPIIPESRYRQMNLPFPYEKLPELSNVEYMAAWKNADRSRGVPVLLRRDPALMDMLEEHPVADGPLPDIDAFLEPHILELMEDEESTYSLGQPGDTAPGVTAFQSFQLEQCAVLLAYVPVEEPWQVFRHIPVGGWNECPEAETIMAFCKKMYEQFGAVPAVVSEDTLELVPARRPDAEEVYRHAQEMYAFAPDIVCQGDAPSVYALADSLTKSDVWYFWWD